MTHPNVSGSEALMAELCTNYEGARGLQAKYKRSPLKSGSIRVWCVVWHRKVQGKRVMKKKMKAEKEVQVVAEEELEVVDLGFSLEGPRPISISASLTEREKLELILLLKEFKDVFAWDYSEMPGLDPRLVVHTLNVDPEAKPVAQPARIFHTEIEGQIVKEVQKLLVAGFIKPIQHPRWLSNIVPVKKKNG